MLLEEIINQPNSYLTKLGFVEVWENTTSQDRWVWFRKTLFTIGELNIIFEITLNLSVFFIPPSATDENFSYKFCKIISTKKDINYTGFLADKKDLTTSETILNIVTTNELRAFLLSAETINNFTTY